MAKPMLIIKNISREMPGLLAEVLGERDAKHQVVDLQKGEVFPDPTEYGALVVLGGPNSANDTDKSMLRELEQVLKAIEAGIPYLGVCLGLQVLVKAGGGSVVENHVKEIGFRDHKNERFTIELTEAGKADPLFAGLGDSFEVFHLHGETVELAPGMELLGTGVHCQNQIVRFGEHAYGLQCHFELTESMLEVWLENDPDLQAAHQDQIRSDYQTSLETYSQVGKTIFNNFLTIAGY